MAVQPRKAARSTVNETLRDRGIAHAVYLERLKAEVGRRLLAYYDKEVVPELTARLVKRLATIESRGYDFKPKETARLLDLLAVMESTVEAWSTGLAKQLADEVTEIAIAEAGWADDAMKAALPIVWDTVVPASKILAAAVLESPIDGVLLEDIVGRLDAASKTNIERAIRIGIAEGESIERIRIRINKATDLTRSSAEAVARTAVGHASNMGRTAYYAENSDIVKKVQWVSTLDTRTCASCSALDGKLFEVGAGARPPRHINCRCTTVPVLRSLRELGLSGNDYEPSTRASMDGQVAATQTYNSWLKRMPASIQDEALGPSRGKLFRSGNLDATDFVDRGGDPYTLKELKAREARAWSSAGL